jgi:hypothetical protein
LPANRAAWFLAVPAAKTFPKGATTLASIEGDTWKMKVDRSGEPKREPGPR